MMQKKTDEIEKYMKDCTLCPRNCHADRMAGRTGYCGMTDKIYAARAALHMWEEPCISGCKGSGAVFFTGCGLRCCFCQNREIAIGKLSDREQTILRLRFGIGSRDSKEQTQKEVADLLGISQSYISRLEKRIMKRLKKEIVKYE